MYGESESASESLGNLTKKIIYEKKRKEGNDKEYQISKGKFEIYDKNKNKNNYRKDLVIWSYAATKKGGEQNYVT